MASVAPVKVSQAGTKIEFTVCAAAGDKVLAVGVGRIAVEFRNASAGQRTITMAPASVTVNDPIYGIMQKASSVVALDTGEECAFFLDNPFGLADDEGNVSFTYSDHADLVIRAVRL